jgi:phospholipid/cholesterol/gamma-HCH transport system permease protein
MNATFGIQDRAEGRTLQPSGDWTVLLLGKTVVDLREQVDRAGRADRLDLSTLGRVDTSGAFVLLGALKPLGTVKPSHADFNRLSNLIRPAAQNPAELAAKRHPFLLFERIGLAVIQIGSETYDAMAFAGELVSALGRTIRHPRRLRLTPLFAVMEQAGIDSIPIVMTMTFFIGAVIALVGANLLTDMGVGVYTVELVGAAILREFGVVIAAILLAGRTASAFAAEIGSMRMNQEIDALHVLGVDQFDALIVPRILACLLMMPLMTFCADIGGMLGGITVSWAMLDINPVFFAQRTLETVNLTQFWLGMVKAPFLAIIIAGSGCRKGLSVSGDVSSLGRAVTSAVVQSIFLLIMFDAIFAVVFMKLNV